MTRTRLALLTAACALTVAFTTSAFALNPQPLPPGRTAAATHIASTNGGHFHR
ncbi:MAG: hypothetical protein WCA56_06685 [Xanthobacteraceae bacterium]|jgi:hypothetical protein